MDNGEGCGFAVGNQFRGGEWTLLIAVHDSNGDASIVIGHEEALLLQKQINDTIESLWGGEGGRMNPAKRDEMKKDEEITTNEH